MQSSHRAEYAWLEPGSSRTHTGWRWWGKPLANSLGSVKQGFSNLTLWKTTKCKFKRSEEGPEVLCFYEHHSEAVALWATLRTHRGWQQQLDFQCVCVGGAFTMTSS